jgi:hypothetical protein
MLAVSTDGRLNRTAKNHRPSQGASGKHGLTQPVSARFSVHPLTPERWRVLVEFFERRGPRGGHRDATGARPRKLVFTGLDSLTAQERRVTEMAAEGLSNPEIAHSNRPPPETRFEAKAPDAPCLKANRPPFGLPRAIPRPLSGS